MDVVAVRYINALLDLIAQALTALAPASDGDEAVRQDRAGAVPSWAAVRQHYANHVQYIEARQRGASAGGPVWDRVVVPPAAAALVRRA